MLPPRGARARRSSVEAAVSDGQRADACRYLSGGIDRLQQGSGNAARALRAHPGLVRSRNRAAGVAADGTGADTGGGLTRLLSRRVGKGAGTASLNGNASRAPCPPAAFMRVAPSLVGTAHDGLPVWKRSASAFAHPTR